MRQSHRSPEIGGSDVLLRDAGVGYMGGGWGGATSYAISELAAQKEEQQQKNETTSRPCCVAWLRLLGYLYVSLLQTRKPLLLDPDVRGRTDGSLAEGWQPDPAEAVLLQSSRATVLSFRRRLL